MVYRKRIYYTNAQKAEMWNRWQKGESLNSIARLFDRGHSSIQGILAETGGITLQRGCIQLQDMDALKQLAGM